MSDKKTFPQPSRPMLVSHGRKIFDGVTVAIDEVRRLQPLLELLPQGEADESDVDPIELILDALQGVQQAQIAQTEMLQRLCDAVEMLQQR